MSTVLNTCPSCRHALEITALHCPHCDIVIQGHFQNSPTLALSDDHSAFLKVFVLSRGNLKEIERILGISYPTVRSKLDQLVEAFQGGSGEESSHLISRNDVLERISRKELTISEGLDMLDRLSPGTTQQSPSSPEDNPKHYQE